MKSQCCESSWVCCKLRYQRLFWKMILNEITIEICIKCKHFGNHDSLIFIVGISTSLYWSECYCHRYRWGNVSREGGLSQRSGSSLSYLLWYLILRSFIVWHTLCYKSNNGTHDQWGAAIYVVTQIYANLYFKRITLNIHMPFIEFTTSQKLFWGARHVWWSIHQCFLLTFKRHLDWKKIELHIKY